MNRLNHRACTLRAFLVGVALLTLLVGCGGKPATPTAHPQATRQASPAATTFISPQPFDSTLPGPRQAQAAPKSFGWVAFHSERSGNLDIWIVRDDGSDLRQLTTNPERDIEPDWSPDGKQFVFASGRDDPEKTQIYVMNADGGNQRPLLPFVAANHLGPRWSPDGKSVAFYTNRDGNLEIYVASVADDQVVNVSQNAADDFSPAWSPDGKQLVFVSNREEGTASGSPATPAVSNHPHIWVMQADGSNARQLTRGDWDDQKPDWSPDGKRIVFTSTRSGYPAPWVIAAAGSEPVSIADNVTVKNRDTRWAGNNLLVFSSDRVRGLWAIYRMNEKGQEVYALTTDATLDGAPAWTKGQ